MDGIKISIFCILVGIGILGVGYYFQRRSQAIERWPGTSGIIKSVDVVKKTRTERTSGRNKSTQTRTTVAYYPVIKYGYTVLGRKYTSDTISIDGPQGASKPEYLDPYLRQYPPGQQVTVYYAPEDPSDAVLKKETGQQIILYIIGLIWSSVWAMVLIIALLVKKFR